MRITRIRLLGFKSFAQKTEFELDPGITAIVGPNGCGKSNVIDAVKWVLGEQRPSSLRAKEMMDVIFAGSDRRKPLGMAEVSLTFDNSDGLLDVERTEVVVSRRLYRSGESEYLLNGDLCRLRDLREILMDTGSGLDALAIMEQGRIDAILTANPVERRVVFEEAAGIGRFKSRRKETLRRLDRVGDDLMRLRDVIEITEKQLRSLRYQASRAKRFRTLTEALLQKRVTWSLYRYHRLLDERESVASRMAELAEVESRANRELRGLVGELSAKECSVQELASRMHGAEAGLLELSSEIRALHQRAEHEGRMAVEFGDRARWCEAEIKVTERRIEETEEEGSALSDELAALSAEAGLRETEFTVAEEAIRAAKREQAEAEEAVGGLKRRQVALLQKSTALRNERAGLEAALRSRRAESERLAARRSAIEQEREGCAAERSSVEEGLVERRRREEELRGRLHAAEEEEAELDARLADVTSQAAGCDGEISGCRSRLDLLRSMKARREGMDQAVSRLLAEAAREGTVLSGIHGIVADLVQVGAADSEVVELALGACAQAIVTQTLEDALGAISWLKEKRLGRAFFLPLDGLRLAGPLWGGTGAARRAEGAVLAPEEYSALVSALLSDSLLVEDVDAALRVSRETEGAFRIVTGGGEVLNRIGGISGGRGKAPAALVARNTEIRDQGEVLASARKRRGVLEESLGRLRQRRDEVRGELRTLREELEIAQRSAREAEGLLARLVRDLKRLADEERVLGVEQAESARARKADAERDGELKALDAELAEEERGLSEEAGKRQESLERAAGVTLRAAELRTEIRVVLAGVRERVVGAEKRCSDLVRSSRDLHRSVELLRAEGKNCLHRREEAERAATEAEQAAEEGETRQQRSRSEVELLRGELEKARVGLLGRREDAERLREEHEDYRSSLEEFRLEERETRTKIEGLLERVAEEFTLDLADLYEGFQPEDVDWDTLDEEVTDLRRKIDRMGNVNLEAIDQLSEVGEQVTFLHGEEADLKKAREELLAILRKVNRESRERFESAFTRIREHFREMFRKLFGGGSGEILLAEGEDILEAGIDIVVRPPGRELQNLNLLSGGEKTLTAVALLFAIFKAHPSPFALMDEVDAALDESNIDRFLSVLREFSDSSQFIIITHNRRTMVEADALYGVSMPEPGVSEQVSIRLTKRGEPAAAEEIPASA